MDIQQKLMDISETMEYIKKHLEAGAVTKQCIRLEEISAMLDELLHKGPADSAELEQHYKDAVMEPVIGELKEVGTKLEAGQKVWKDGLLGLEVATESYGESLKDAMEQETKQQDIYQREFEKANQLVQDMYDMVSGWDDGQEKERQAEKLQEQISEIMKQGKQAHDLYMKNAEQLEKATKDMEAAYQSLDSRVAQASKSFAETAGRLENLLGQMEGKKKKWKR